MNTREMTRSEKILNTMLTTSGIKEDDLVIIFDVMRENPELIKAFNSFCIKAKFLAADDIAEVARIKAERARQAEAEYAAVQRRYNQYKSEYENEKKDLARLHKWIEDGEASGVPRLAHQVPRDLLTIFSYCMSEGYIGPRFFSSYLKLRSKKHPRTPATIHMRDVDRAFEDLSN